MTCTNTSDLTGLPTILVICSSVVYTKIVLVILSSCLSSSCVPMHLVIIWSALVPVYWFDTKFKMVYGNQSPPPPQKKKLISQLKLTSAAS